MTDPSGILSYDHFAALVDRVGDLDVQMTSLEADNRRLTFIVSRHAIAITDLELRVSALEALRPEYSTSQPEPGA
jgi:hypothetical protein